MSGLASPVGQDVRLGGRDPTLSGTSNRSRFPVICPYAFQNPHLTFYFAHRRAGRCGFSNYDVPLYTQIVDRIKAKISPRLGDGPLRTSAIL